MQFEFLKIAKTKSPVVAVTGELLLNFMYDWTLNPSIVGDAAWVDWLTNPSTTIKSEVRNRVFIRSPLSQGTGSAGHHFDVLIRP